MELEGHFALSDEMFEQQFEYCQLDPSIFNHEAHLRLAWIHIKKYGLDNAIENICNQLLIYVNFLGARDKYNKTLTIAAIKAVNHFMNKSLPGNFNDFMQQFPRLKYNFKELIASHYTVDIFNSDIAKKEYLEPDLLPFT
jgi:hypothetical protein